VPLLHAGLTTRFNRAGKEHSLHGDMLDQTFKVEFSTTLNAATSAGMHTPRVHVPDMT
jgi:hypothetical protein